MEITQIKNRTAMGQFAKKLTINSYKTKSPDNELAL